MSATACSASQAACSASQADPVNHPRHYNTHPSGVECIQIVEHMGFCLGNAIKYLWRADEKGAPIEDLKKARWYIDREIARREGSEPRESTAQPAPPVAASRCGRRPQALPGSEGSSAELIEGQLWRAGSLIWRKHNDDEWQAIGQLFASSVTDAPDPHS